jgi:hypothetical protein
VTRYEARPVVMMMYCVFVFAATVVVTGTVLSAQAQTKDDPSQLLDVDLTVVGGYDSDAAQAPVSPGFGQVQPAGYSAWGTGSLNYMRQFTQVAFQTSASSAVRYLPDFQEFHSVMHTGAVSVRTGLPNRYGLQLRGAAAYSPSYLYGLFPALPSTSDQEPIVDYSDPYDVDQSSSYSATGSVTVDRRMSRRTRVSVVGNFNHTDFSNDTTADSLNNNGLRDLTVYSFSGRFHRNVTRNNIVSFGYRYSTGTFGYLQTTAEHRVDVDVNGGHQLSASRRLSFMLRVGGSLVEVPEGLEVFDVGPTQYRLTADASVTYPISDIGTLRGSYTRGLQYVGGLTRPVFADGFSGEFNGLVLERIGLLVRASRATGQSLVPRDDLLAQTGDNLLDTYTGQLRVSYRVTRQLSSYAEYLHYMYDTGGQLGTPLIPLAPGLPPDLNRQAIHVGLEWQMPVLRK